MDKGTLHSLWLEFDSLGGRWRVSAQSHRRDAFGLGAAGAPGPANVFHASNGVMLASSAYPAGLPDEVYVRGVGDDRDDDWVNYATEAVPKLRQMTSGSPPPPTRQPATSASAGWP